MKTTQNPLPYSNGVVYNPTWPGWTPAVAATIDQLSDSDFANAAFPALWNSGKDTSGNTFRNDLGTIQSGGFTLVRLYNWGAPRGYVQGSGNSYTLTGHRSFLDYAQKQGLKVMVPVSNWFMSDSQYAWNGQDLNGSLAFSDAPTAIQTDLQYFIASVTDSNGNLHPAVHSFAISNEIDYHSLGDQGGPAVNPTERFNRVMWWIVNLQSQMSAAGMNCMFTAPISNGDQGNPGTSPMSYWFQAFVNGVTTSTPIPANTNGASSGDLFANAIAGLNTITGYENWFFNSVNIYQYGSGLTDAISQYNSWKSNTVSSLNWPGQQFEVPLMFTETGVTRATNDASGQDAQYNQIMNEIVNPILNWVSSNPNSLFSGFCLYEFNDEVWLNDNWGLFMVEPTSEPSGNLLYSEDTGQTVMPWTTWGSISYPVYELYAVQNNSGTTLISALNSAFASQVSSPLTH